jgi:hypothetical protein
MQGSSNSRKVKAVYDMLQTKAGQKPDSHMTGIHHPQQSIRHHALA